MFIHEKTKDFVVKYFVGLESEFMGLNNLIGKAEENDIKIMIVRNRQHLTEYYDIEKKRVINEVL